MVTSLPNVRTPHHSRLLFPRVFGFARAHLDIALSTGGGWWKAMAVTDHPVRAGPARTAKRGLEGFGRASGETRANLQRRNCLPERRTWTHAPAVSNSRFGKSPECRTPKKGSNTTLCSVEAFQVHRIHLTASCGGFGSLFLDGTGMFYPTG